MDTNPVKWDHNFLENLYGHEWELTSSPAGAKQWAPKETNGPSPRPQMLTIRRRSTR